MFDNAYAGIWVNRDSKMEGSDDLEASFKKMSEGQRQAKGLTSGNWWPAYQFEKPSRSDYWNDLQSFREAIVRDLKWFWETFHESIDLALETKGS